MNDLLVLVTSPMNGIIQRGDELFHVNSNQENPIEFNTDIETYKLAARIKWGMYRVIGKDDKGMEIPQGSKPPFAIHPETLDSGEVVFKEGKQ